MALTLLQPARLRSSLASIAEPLDGTVGCSVTVSILDEEMKHLWDAPVHTAALRWDVMQQA